MRYLKDKVTSDGPACVFTRCPQLDCNLKVPHSFFLKYLKEEGNPYLDEGIEDGENIREKYLRWHCKQYTDHNKHLKWCPQKNCDYIIKCQQFNMEQHIVC